MESRLWLRLLGATANVSPALAALRTLYREADELILAAIVRNSK